MNSGLLFLDFSWFEFWVLEFDFGSVALISLLLCFVPSCYVFPLLPCFVSHMPWLNGEDGIRRSLWLSVGVSLYFQFGVAFLGGVV